MPEPTEGAEFPPKRFITAAEGDRIVASNRMQTQTSFQLAKAFGTLVKHHGDIKRPPVDVTLPNVVSAYFMGVKPKDIWSPKQLSIWFRCHPWDHLLYDFAEKWGTVHGMPSPTLEIDDNEDYWQLTLLNFLLAHTAYLDLTRNSEYVWLAYEQEKKRLWANLDQKMGRSGKDPRTFFCRCQVGDDGDLRYFTAADKQNYIVPRCSRKPVGHYIMPPTGGPDIVTGPEERGEREAYLDFAERFANHPHLDAPVRERILGQLLHARRTVHPSLIALNHLPDPLKERLSQLFPVAAVDDEGNDAMDLDDDDDDDGDDAEHEHEIVFNGWNLDMEGLLSMEMTKILGEWRIQ